METQLTKQAGLQKNAEHKTFEQASFKAPMPAPKIVKNASMQLQGMQKTAMMSSQQQPTFWYSPDLTPDAWLLPKSEVEALRFYKIYYNLDPYIHSIINMHAQYGFSKFFLQYKDPSIAQLFNKLLFYNQTFDWYQFVLDMALSYYKYGEAICWGDWNTARRTWNRFTLLDPAIVEYKEDLFTGHVTVELIPTIEMKKAVRTALLQGRTDISPLLVDAIQNNKKLPLDTEGRPENVFTGEEYVPPKVAIFSRKTDPSSTRGTSIISPLLKDLIYKDQLRLSQLAVAQKTQLPIELWTVGHIGNDDQSSMIPGDDLLEEVRQIITEATQQPPYSIVYGPYLKYEALGVAGKLLDIYNDLGYVENQLLVGLGTNKAVVLGEGPNVQGKNIALNRQIRSYQVVRDLFSNFFKTNILLPIARANNLVDEDGQFIIPDLVWELSLQPEQDKEVFDMFYKMWKDGLVSTMTLFEKCPKQIDYLLEMTRLAEEKGTVFDKGDKRLGRAKTLIDDGSLPPDKSKGGGAGGPSINEAGEKGVEAGRGNSELRDFALGGDTGSLDSLSTDMGPDTGTGDAGGAGEAPAAK